FFFFGGCQGFVAASLELLELKYKYSAYVNTAGFVLSSFSPYRNEELDDPSYTSYPEPLFTYKTLHESLPFPLCPGTNEEMSEI
ncbi:MAG TPA: hypothetical protein VNI77_12375, partial [Nitrososphaera sp.]|nr:hypothetical protein [Nitrososphaera sp.]